MGSGRGGKRHYSEADLLAKVRSGQIHRRRSPDGSWRYIRARDGFCNAGCDRAFVSDSAFEAHLRGGRCATDEELKDAGIVSRLNAYGTEVFGHAPTEKSRAYFAAIRSQADIS